MRKLSERENVFINSNLEKLDLISVLNNEVIEKSKPILGMCLGMHLIGEKNEEGPVE